MILLLALCVLLLVLAVFGHAYVLLLTRFPRFTVAMTVICSLILVYSALVAKEAI